MTTRGILERRLRGFAFPLALAVALFSAQVGFAQSIEELELKKAEAEAAAAQEEKPPTLGFGLQALLENGAGINRDRPESYTFLYLAPQLKLWRTFRIQTNLGLVLNHLERQSNPWDFTDWALQISDLSIYNEDYTGIGLSGYVRYSFPTSVGSRNADRYGLLRANLKMSRSIGPIYVSLELNGLRFFHKYTSSDTSRWLESGNISNNPEWGINERLTLGWSPTSQLSVSVAWSMTQLSDYDGESATSIGSLANDPRSTEVWEHSFSALADLTYALTDQFYISGGYSMSASQLQNGGHDVSINPFNPKYGQVYIDLALIY